MEKTRAAVKKARYLAGEELDWDETPTLSNGKRPLNVLNVRINVFGLKDYLIEWDDGTGAGWVSVEELGTASGILKKWEKRANPKGRNMYATKHPQEYETNYERDFSRLSKRKFYEKAMDGVDENSKPYEQPSEYSKSKRKQDNSFSAREISQRKERKTEQSRKRTATEPSHPEPEATENSTKVKSSRIIEERHESAPRKPSQSKQHQPEPTIESPIRLPKAPTQERPSTSRPSAPRPPSRPSAKRISPLPATREDPLLQQLQSDNSTQQVRDEGEPLRASSSRRAQVSVVVAEESSKEHNVKRKSNEVDRSSKGSKGSAGIKGASENSTVLALAALQSEDDQPGY